MIDRERSLFSDGDLVATLEAANEKLRQRILRTSEEYLLNVDIDEWVAHLVSDQRVEPLALVRADMYVEDLGESDVDVQYDRGRALYDHSGPFYVPGRAAELHIPFTGDPTLFRLRPNTFTYSPPVAEIRAAEVIRFIDWPADSQRPELRSQADQLRQYHRAVAGLVTPCG